VKPIRLKLSGLHSFREEQIVDFASLCQGGVFGIFGPTGSGKSSLLDAITLALYGKVERASNNTQGIMNQGENQLSVSFTFQLGNASGVKQYRVERRMKRVDEVKVRTVTSRLVEILGDEETVLADKDRDVTRQIENILGLTADDFTRAVVLPQGKFAEFLSLKGTDRRQMLQRLFHLEQYGDQLNQKVKHRVEETKSEVAQLVAEQTGLGEASQEDVQQAKERVELAQQEVELWQNLFEKNNQKYEEAKVIRGLQVELSGIEKEINKLVSRIGEMKEIEKRLHLARQGEILRPYAEGLEKILEELKTWEQRHEQVQNELAEAEKAWKLMNEEYEAHVNKALIEEPQLTIRLEQLKQAIQLEQELQRLRQEVNLLQQRGQNLTEEYVQIKQRKETSEEKLEKALRRQQELQEQLHQNMVSSVYREKVNQAIKIHQQILSEEKRFGELEREGKKKEKDLREAKTHLSLILQSRQQLQSMINEALGKAQRLFNQLKEWENRAQTGGEALLLHNQRLTLENEQMKTRNLAQQLARELHAGQPCPVCGSTHHPNPIANEIVGDEEEVILQQLQLCQELMGRGQSLFNQYRELSLQLDGVFRSLYELKTEEDDDIQSFSTDEIPPFTGDLPSILHVFQQGEKELLNYKNQVSDLARLTTEIRQKSAVLSREEAQWQSAIDHQEKSFFENQEKLNRQQMTLIDLKKQWDDSFADFSRETIEQEGEKIRQQDEIVEDRQKRLKISEVYIEERKKEILNFNEQEVQLEKEIVRLETEFKSKVEMKGKIEQEFRKIAGEEKVEVLFHQTQAQLQQLKMRTSQLASSLEEKRKGYSEKEKETGIVVQRMIDCRKKKDESVAIWEKKLAESDFSTMEQMKESLLLPEEETRLVNLLDEYKDQWKKWHNEKQRVEQLLNGRHIGDDEWTTIQGTLEQTKLAYEKAKTEKIRSLRDLEDVEQRHGRWLELEKERKEKQTLLDRLLKLQQVLRGNGFVEFIAEEQLTNISLEASARLGNLTHQRYALEVDSSGGFVIRDNANGGVRRPVSTLSGGETFLTSLSLALALSSQIQLRGEYPLEFFFLDEGFGTLDQELLDTVVTALEKLHSERLAIGIISHVPELRARLPRRLIVEPAEPSGRGSRVRLETL